MAGAVIEAFDKHWGVSKNLPILLANLQVPKCVCPTCLLGRQKAWETYARKGTARTLKEVGQQ
jgi:hypothetical protein